MRRTVRLAGVPGVRGIKDGGLETLSPYVRVAGSWSEQLFALSEGLMQFVVAETARELAYYYYY